MREIILIKTSEGEKIKSLLNEKGINYLVIYDDILYDKNLNEEEIWRRDIQLANQDEKRNREIAEWDQMSDEDDWESINNGQNWN